MLTATRFFKDASYAFTSSSEWNGSLDCGCASWGPTEGLLKIMKEGKCVENTYALKEC